MDYKNYKSSGEICNICRQKMTDGVKLKYGSPKETFMCKQCFNRCFKDSEKKRNISLADSDLNFVTQYRPAKILENPHKKNSDISYECGFEYPLPHISEYHIVTDFILWCIILFAAKIMIGSSDIGKIVYDSITLFFSGIWALANFKTIIQGIFLGISNKRKLMLLISGILLLVFSFIALSDLRGLISEIY